MVTIDWEGHWLPDEGLEAIESFRKDWPALPITHYVSAAYFSSPAGADGIAKKIASAVRPGDEVGVHFHGWFSLVQASGVQPRVTPNFYLDKEPLAVVPQSGDKGYEVPLSAYSPDEITRLVSTSRSLLVEAGLPVGTSFRVGGYAASQETLHVLRREGFLSDSSAVWSGWFDEARGAFQAEVARYWPKTQELTQPYVIETPSGPLIEVPNSGGFVEYVDSDEMLAHLRKAQAASLSTSRTIYVGFGLHQDTADEYIHVLGDALLNFNEKNPGVLEFATVTAVSRAAVPIPQTP